MAESQLYIPIGENGMIYKKTLGGVQTLGEKKNVLASGVIDARKPFTQPGIDTGLMLGLVLLASVVL